METLIHADIFFFISSVSSVLFAVGFVVVVVYVVRILDDMKHISTKMREEGDRIVEDVEVLREKAKEEGVRIKSVFDFFLDLLNRRQKRIGGQGGRAKK